jgi:hypothetical protein
MDKKMSDEFGNWREKRRTTHLVFAVAVNHSPAMEMTSKPEDNWLKKCG